MIKTNCPNCFRQYEVEDSAAGRYADCPSCGKRFRVQAAVTKTGYGRPERLSIALALVFQCIFMGGTLLQAIAGMDGDEAAAAGVAVLFLVPAILCAIFSAILHYKCWAAMPEGFARMTPGKAVGYLFIPCFNLFWVFPTFGGLGSDCAALARAKGLRGHDGLGGLGVAFAVVVCVELALGWVPGLGLLLSIAEFILWILFYQGVTKLLNNPAATAPAAPSAD